MEAFSTAGQNGYYQYNEETKTYEYHSGEQFDFPALYEEQEEQGIPLPEISPQAGGIFESDNRVLVQQPAGYLSSTCLIGARFGTLVNHATGWLINERYLVTAAHVVYEKGYGTSEYGFADHVAVYVGASGGNSKQYRRGQVYAVGGDYIGGTDYGIGKYDDWAVVKLEQPVTVSVSYLGLRPVNSASEMSSLGYSTQGYPCDKNGCDKPGAIWDNSSMYRTTGYILGDKARYLDLVITNIDMYKGQSGSPVWRYSSSDGYRAEAMVIAYSEYGGSTENYLILINDWLYNYLTTNCKA